MNSRLYYKITVFVLTIAYQTVSYAQNSQTDTVLFLIDKNMKEYEYRTPIKNSNRFDIKISCKYYTQSPPAFFNFIELVPNDYNMNISVEKTKWRIDKKQLKGYQLINMEWVAEQKSLNMIYKELYKNSRDSYYYILFKDELDCTKSDSVLLHQVHVGHVDIDIE
ncbi:hypothetical protein ACT3CE_01230 [Marinifilum sp. RC60d5]|uniref:hypothetical protein n=1 Tax=Marinifilum sp. RC60d5 TaxID=3458414 RepID=UPI004035478A